MNYIKFVIYLTLLTMHILYANSVIFLEGSSRSGKSSICDAIKQHKNWESVSSLYLYYCHEVFNDIAPSEFACIKKNIERENITHAITKNIFIFKENVDDIEKNMVRQAVEKIQDYFNDQSFCASHMEEFSAFALSIVDNLLNKDLHVLADVSWYVTQEKVRETDPMSIIVSALAYCPFNIIIDRILYRNKLSLETGNIMNYRFLKEPLKSFEALYDLSTESIGSIDTLKKTIFFDCLDAIALYLPENAELSTSSDFIMQELTHEQLQAYQVKFLKKFGNNDTLYIVPKKTYDILIKTNRSTPEECAEQIVRYINNLSSNKF